MINSPGQPARLHVLGATTASLDGVTVDLGPQLQRLLAALVTHRNSVVSADRLVDILWPIDPPKGALKSLKSYVTRLRRTIDPQRVGVITFTHPGYVLSSRHVAIDSDDFESELDDAVQAMRTADHDIAVTQLTTALARWQGDAYAGLEHEEWVRPEAVRLEERRVEARELLVEAHLATSQIERALADAQSLVESHPLRDRPRALLMRALFASGRQTEALREFRRFRSSLAEEVGLDPSAELVELESRIARSDETVLGRVRALRGYELAERIGEGAYAVVHRAVQPGVERDVAIKIIRPELADRPEFIRRFESEARLIAAVEHPHVVPLYDFWREPGAAYLVMRLLRGGSVEDRLRSRGPFSREATAQVLRDVGAALETAHRLGVVHRDIRPANLLLDDDGSTYLADFGIAVPSSSNDRATVISPAYASPEMLLGEPTGPATDVLSLAITTFELLTGVQPFITEADPAVTVRRRLAETLPPVSSYRSQLPGAIDDVLARATARQAGKRHASVTAFVDEMVAALGEIATRRVVVPSASNPYVGLHAFDERDADRFHGRDELVAELLDAVASRPFTLLVGPSGSGKSSVVRAGLVPALRRGQVPGSSEWFMTGMTPGDDPVHALDAALARVAVRPTGSLREQLEEPGGLLRAIHRVLPGDGSQLLLVIDQFEELFTMSGTAEHDRFLRELATAITASGSPLHVVATLRADHYDVPLRHPDFAQLASDGTIAIRPMSASELEQVVVLPAGREGVTVEPALVAELVAGVAERPAALPLLQFALTESFERRVSDLMLLATHVESGGLTGSVAARADQILAEGDPGDELLARRIFSRLVTLDDGAEDTRRRARRSELSEDSRTTALIDAFVAARLLSTGLDDDSREPTVEVAHEALLRDWPRLRGWIAEDRTDLLALRAVAGGAEAWTQSERDPGDLARHGRLSIAEELQERRPDWLSDAERTWIRASQAARDDELAEQRRIAENDQRQNTRLRRLLVGTAVLLVVALVAAAAAVVLRNRAVDNENQAIENENRAIESQARAVENEARALAAQEDADIERLSAVAVAQVDESPALAILLALEANRRRDDVGTQNALHTTIAAQPALTGIFSPPGGVIETTVISRNGNVGAAFTSSADSGQVRWFDPATGEPIGANYSSESPIDDIALAGNGSVAAVAVRDGTVRFVDVDGAQLGAPVEQTSLLFSMSLDRAGRRVALRSEAGTRIVDVASGETLSTYLDPADTPGEFVDAPVALTDDGRRFVVSWVHSRFGDGPALTIDGAIGGYDVVNADTGEVEERVEAEFVNSLAVSTLDRLAVAYNDGTVTVHDLDRPDEPVTLSGADGEASAIGIAPNGMVGVGTFEGTVQFWDRDGTPITSPIAIGGLATDVAFDAFGASTVTIEGEGYLRFRPEESAVIERIRLRVGLANNVYTDHPFYEAVTGDFNAVQFRRLSDDSVAGQLSITAPPATPFYSGNGQWAVQFDRLGDGSALITNVPGMDTPVEVDLVTAYERHVGRPFSEDLRTALRPSNDGSRLFVGTIDLVAGGAATVLWVDINTGDAVAGPLAIPTLGRPLMLDDGRVVMGDGDSEMFILDAALSGPPTVVADSAGFRGFDQHPASGTVLAGSTGGVALLDPDTGEFRRLESSTGLLAAGTFSPDGERVAVLATGGEVQIIDVESGRRVGLPMTRDRTLILPQSIHWAATDTDGTDADGGDSAAQDASDQVGDDGNETGGVWVGSFIGPINFAADPAAWRRIACQMVDRELTADEWRAFVSETEPHIPACT